MPSAATASEAYRAALVSFAHKMEFSTVSAVMVVDRLHEIASDIMGNTICALGDGAAMPMLGILKLFRSEFEAAVQGAKAPKLGENHP